MSRIKKIKERFFALIDLKFGSKKISRLQDPVQWRFVAKKEDEASYSLNFMAIIQPPWSIYIKTLDEIGKSLLNFEYKPNIHIIFKDVLQERGTPVEYYDFILKSDVKMYKRPVNFVQLVKICIDEPISIQGTLHYVVGDGIDELKTYKKYFEFEING